MPVVVPVPYAGPDSKWVPDLNEILPRIKASSYHKCISCQDLVDVTVDTSVQLSGRRFEDAAVAMFITEDEEHFLCPTCTVEQFPKGYLKDWSWKDVSLEVVQKLVGVEAGKEFFKAIQTDPSTDQRW